MSRLSRLTRNGLWAFSAVLSIAIVASAFYASGIELFEPTLHRSLAILASVVLVVTSTPLVKSYTGNSQIVSLFLIAIDLIIVCAISAGIYQFISVDDALSTGLYDFSETDKWMALCAMLAIIELTRRIWGNALAIFTMAALGYCFFGEYLPGIFYHTGFSFDEISRKIWYGFNGVFGTAIAVVVSLVWIFIILGVLLEGLGAGEVMLRITMAVTARLRGGPAHAAIFSSSVFGTMSGSSIANVVGTGTFTIPMIIKRGFSRPFAGGIEATASCGGQLVPPIMGAAAFLMSDLTNTPYFTIVTAALIPAVLYYLSLFVAVTFEAAKLGIEPVPIQERVPLNWNDLFLSLTFLVPILTIIGIMAAGFSPARAGFWAAILAIVFSVLHKKVRHNPSVIFHTIVKAGRGAATICVAVAAIGIIIGAMNMTGLGLRFAGLIDSFGQESLWISLVLTMCGALVLGMGMPTLPAYLIIVLVMGPALLKLGLPVLVVHLFVLYYGVVSSITPPVALAAIAAAPIAGADPMRTSLVAMRLGAVKFLVPFVFVYNPELLLVLGFEWSDLVLLLARALLFVWLLTSALSGFEVARIGPVERTVRAMLGVFCMVPNIVVFAPAVLFGLAIFLLHRFRNQQVVAKHTL